MNLVLKTKPYRIAIIMLSAIFTASLVSSCAIWCQHDEEKAPKLSFSEDPPVIKFARVRLLDKPTALGNAVVEISYAKDKRLSGSITLSLEKSAVTFLDDGRQFDRVAGDGIYTGVVSLDVAAIKRNQNRLHKIQQTSRHKLMLPVYSNRTLLTRLPIPSDYFRAIRNGINFNFNYFAYPGDVDPARSLIIRDLRTVEDPTRTYNICTGVGNPNGKWTFSHLMSQMANPALTGIDPSDFVLDWLHQQETVQTVNGWNINPTDAMDFFISNLPRLPNGKLDLRNAPFRLLAIVNRIDLRHNPVYGGGDAGEVRFVFGTYGCASGEPTRIPVRKMTVILEYGIHRRGCAGVKNWGQQWYDLGNHPLGSAAYNSALQAITDQFTEAGAERAKPNGSALNQLRTNSGFDADWQLREFRLSARNVAGQNWLTESTVAQTPDTVKGLELSSPAQFAFSDYVNSHAALIIAQRHNVPLSYEGSHFRGGASVVDSSIPDPWNSDRITNRNARHMFALQTCSGCHSSETGTPSSGPNLFFQIIPTPPGTIAGLSGFITGIDVPDPFDGTPIRHFNELERRATDLDGLANNVCLAFVDNRFHKLEILRMVH